MKKPLHTWIGFEEFAKFESFVLYRMCDDFSASGVEKAICHIQLHEILQ